MNEQQLATIRDDLIAELPTPKSSAAKFEPALLGWRNRNGLKAEQAADPATLDRAMTEVRALITSAHERAITNLALVLAQPEFSGLTAQEIYDRKLLTESRPIMTAFPIPTAMQEIVAAVLGSMASRPADLTVFDDGTVVTDNKAAAEEISRRIGMASVKSGLTEAELTAPRMVERETGRTVPLISIAWQGIPYTYNTPPVEVIQLALDRRA